MHSFRHINNRNMPKGCVHEKIQNGTDHGLSDAGKLLPAVKTGRCCICKQQESAKRTGERCYCNRCRTWRRGSGDDRHQESGRKRNQPADSKEAVRPSGKRGIYRGDDQRKGSGAVWRKQKQPESPGYAEKNPDH